MAYKDPERPLAVLIDAENMHHKYLKIIMAISKNFGRAITKRAYGDWSLTSMRHWRKPLLRYDVEPRQSLQVVSGKNLSDIALTVDAMDLLHAGTVKGICLVSSDSDFTPLVRRLRHADLFVMGIGSHNTARAFREVYDYFLNIDAFIKKQKRKQQHKRAQIAAQREWTARDRQLRALLVQAAQTENGDQKWVNLGAIGKYLSENVPEFNIKTYGYPKLIRSIETFNDLFEIEHRGTICRVRLYDGR